MSSIRQLSKRLKYTGNWSFILAIISTVGYLALGQIVQLYWSMIFWGLVGTVAYAINSIIEQELKAKMIEEEIQEYPVAREELLQNLFILIDGKIKPALNILNDISSPTPETTLIKDEFSSLLNEWNALVERATSYLIITEWLANRERRIFLAKKAGNIALKKYPLRGLPIPHMKKKRRHRLYQDVYDCITWIKHSFAAGCYLAANKLKLKIVHKIQVITALELFIYTEEKEDLLKDIPKSIRPEIEIYFKKLIEEISESM